MSDHTHVVAGPGLGASITSDHAAWADSGLPCLLCGTRGRKLVNGEVWELRRDGYWHMISPDEPYSPVGSEHFDSYARIVRAGRSI